MSERTMAAIVGCTGCQSFHVPVDRIEEAIQDEILRGYWKHATVKEALPIVVAARDAGRCIHSCHEQNASGAPGDQP